MTQRDTTGGRSVQPAPGSVWRAARIAAGLVLALILVRFAAALGEFFWFALTCPYEMEYAEGILLQNAINIAHGREVYNDYRHYPFVAATYPPLYPALCAIGVRLFGVTFTFGRALSILSALASAALIWAIMRRVVSSRFAAGLAALLFIGAPAVSRWGVMMRVDLVALGLSLAGFYCVVRGGRWLGGAALLLALAVYARQSQVAALAASAAYLCWSRQRKQAALLAAVWAALVLGGFAVLQLASHGWFYRHVIVANMNLWELDRLIMIWRTMYRAWRFPFLIGLVGLGFAILSPGADNSAASQLGRQPTARLVALYFLFAVLVSATAGKIGAHLNYMLEPLAGAAMLSGIAYQRLHDYLATGGYVRAWVVAWLLMVAPPAWRLAQVGPPGWRIGLPHRPPHHPHEFLRDRVIEAGRRALPIVRATRGDILSENTGLLVLAGRRILLDPHKMTSMAKDGNWDQRPLLRDIQRRRFALIITTWNPATSAPDRWGTYGYYRWTMGMGRAIQRNYYLREQAGNLYLLAPADARHPSFEARRVRYEARRLRLR